MGCILGCLRLGGNDRKKGIPVAASPGCSNSMEHSVSANQLASVFLCEERDSPCLGDITQDTVNGDSEAKFLLACGAILESPAEFPEGHKKFSFEAEQEDSISLESPLWFHASPQKPMHEEHTNQTSSCSLSVNGGEGVTAHIPGSCEFAEPQASCKKEVPLSLLMLEPQVANLHTGVNAVYVEDVKGYSATECLRKSSFRDISTPEINQQRELLDSNLSPYPTPLNLSDELQTPGTIYPTCQDKFITFRDGIRYEFIYPETKPFVDTSVCKPCKDEPYHHSHHSDEHVSTGVKFLLNESSKEQKPPFPNGGINTREPLDSSLIPSFGAPEVPIAFGQLPKSPGSPVAVLPCLSQWQEPAGRGIETMSWEVLANEKSNTLKNLDQDRPIIGAVAAHWREDEILQVSPKQWNGNGVPNSTSKYKEDQKVSWHATPFEKRLEKALVEENLFTKVTLQELS